MTSVDLISAADVAKYLLKISAVKLSPNQSFTWASGWKSPIYCDNRKTLSYPEIRDYIKHQFVRVIKSNFPLVEVIAGVATGAIAQGALIADSMNLPFVYVRSEAKSHGLENQVEGVIQNHQKVVVIEDLISTGGSSLKAVEALKKSGADVLGMSAIFTYSFQNAIDNFEKASCNLITLSNYESLIDFALVSGYISQTDVATLIKWRENPAEWGK